MRRLVFLVSLLAVCASAFAQQAPKPPKITWLRFYQVQPGKDADFLKLIGSSRPMLDKLTAAGKVAGWGVAVPLTHNDEPWTHVVFVGLADWSAAEAMVRGFEEGPDMGISAIVPGSVRDVILHHITQSEQPPKAPPKYIGVDFYTVKQGRQGDAVALFNEWAKPMFTELAAKGNLGPWGFSMQSEMAGYTHMVWFFMSDLTAFDDNDVLMKSMDPMKLRGFDVRLRDMSEPEKHRTQLLRIVMQ
jgi:hypothetical protein